MAGPEQPRTRTLLVLDLDETLIHASDKRLHRAADFEIFGYHVYLRPHLAGFLADCARHYDLAIWSSASDDYVAAVAQRIFPDPSLLRFVWGRSRASLRRFPSPDDVYLDWPSDHRHYLKPLAKLKRRGWPLERILIVDDTPEKCVRNYGNAIYARPFEGEEDDTELKLLGAYLATLKDRPNVRQVEKRRWRDEMSGRTI
jgi:RNA polymerase II subunit A small phosphatase-like protein